MYACVCMDTNMYICILGIYIYIYTYILYSFHFDIKCVEIGEVENFDIG